VTHAERHRIESSTDVHASADAIWGEITEVDIASFQHPTYLRLLDIPKPLRAEIVATGVGGSRVATFGNGRRFSQRITEWQPHERYAFTFEPDPGFRVAYVLDLSRGPFRLCSGAYRIETSPSGTRLSLASEYELEGTAGALLRWPTRGVLSLFQRYLLQGIKANAERRSPVPER
jgi:hypothetical protein